MGTHDEQVPSSLVGEACALRRRALSRVMATLGLRLEVLEQGAEPAPQIMIKPTAHERVVIDVHRRDWP